jgi:hypothetical protein
VWEAGAAAAGAFSFGVVGLFGGRNTADRASPRLDLLQFPIGRLLASRGVRAVLQAASVAMLILLVAAGVAGDQTPTRNLLPVWIWVIWWVGFAYVSALAGNFWAVVNPWAAVFGWIDAARRRLRRRWPDRPYPAALGTWPAVVLFAAFAWAELVYTGRTSPAKLALMIAVYSAITWTGMLVFGRAAWLRYGDPFATAFGVLARFSPTEIRVTRTALCRRCPARCGETGTCTDCAECFDRAAPGDRQWNLRPYGSGLVAGGAASVSMTAFVLLVLATVTFDGFTATPAWAALESWLYGALTPLGALRLTVIGTLGLVAFPIAFAAVYALFALWMSRAAGGGPPALRVAGLFVASLVPIAIAYHLAHYFTYLLIHGQLVIRLASDPFGVGWNLFGTARYRPDIGVVGARAVWHIAVGAIVIGHIIAVYVAHAIALREYPTRDAAIRSQIPMLFLMVTYTILSLWIVAQPIVETSASGG